MTPISCYIRTLNEERLIGEVLAAAKRLTDDVIILDSGSTDKTLDIAKNLDARIIQQHWLGNGKQKRIGEDAAKHNWVLDIDADEILSDGLTDEIRALLGSLPDPSTLYALRLVTVPPIGRPWYNFDNVRRIKIYNTSLSLIHI